jgi:hypothetical protein
MVDSEQFKKATELVINNLEGGYYNPAWHNTKDSRYSTSGETMFGIDRKNGGTINTSEAGKKFWAIIDANKTPAVWKWDYRGGALAPQLKDLVGQMMQPTYELFAKNSMSPQLRETVEKDPRLLFHFIYAVWNGSGWFAKFAKDMDSAMAKGVHDSDGLVRVAIDSRTKEGYTKGSPPNSLVKQSGDNINSFINTIPAFFKSVTETTTKAVEKTAEVVKENIVPTVIITVVLIISTYTLVKFIKKGK